ncbi:hypothetical protein SAMN02745975_00303 [Geosporobacter subterraneus DSM 17957]|uniref:Uncharacterized protein n=1 Tax=Geosporobacter subterraneus DSM 17957 TaxID=1121919 RepID=A0A1M6CRG2_9FIRM|nr:hypothetical protein [Geosporobacter subterraneus]SHI63550.1 hypothetical protein SAMN02745975_00303 [Geosporobacter subterraneus DSM 17957]
MDTSKLFNIMTGLTLTFGGLSALFYRHFFGGFAFFIFFVALVSEVFLLVGNLYEE